MQKKIILWVVAYLVWCLLNWVPDWQHLVTGIPVCALVVFVIGDLFVKRPHVLKHPSRYWYFFAWYLPVFLWEMIKANLDVAYRVLHPALPIRPGIVKVKTRLKSDTGLTFLANSITLTPGTMCVDIDRERGLLFIHWINVRETDLGPATEKIVRTFENILEKIFE